jgi:hypothetical protein
VKALREDEVELSQPELVSIVLSQGQTIEAMARQLDWLARHVFGTKSERVRVLENPQQMALGDILAPPDKEMPSKECTVAAHTRRERRRDGAAVVDAESVPFFDEHRVPVQTIPVAHPEMQGLSAEEVVERSFFGVRYSEIAKRAETAREPEEILRITASISRVILDTEREEIGLMRGISALSPELKAIETELETLRFTLQEARARLLVKSVPVAHHLGLARVRDILWMYTARNVYRMLVLERGWSSDEYEPWLAETLIKALMR